MLQGLLLLLISHQAQAFPEMVRHNYVNCTTCHVSPAGGGLMTPYGRSMSKEILSRWSYEGEENILHGAIQKESLLQWLNGSREVGFNVGGDVRYLQTYRDNNFVEEGKFFPMQRDLEGAFRFYNLTVVAGYGIQYKPGEDEFDSRRSYVMYQLLESVSVRAGRFLPIYSLMIADHYTSIKRGLGFDQGRERDTAEINYTHDQWSVSASFSKSPKSTVDALEEEAASVQVNYAIADKYKVGVSYWNGKFDSSRRQILGVHGIWGFTHDWYMLSEIDYQELDFNAAGATRRGIFYYNKLGYEFTRGVHALFQIDGSQSDLDVDMSKTFAYGLGLNIYPRPHFEIQGLWTRATIKAIDNDEMDMAHLVLHYYF